MGHFYINNATGLILRLNTTGGLEKWELSNNYLTPTASLVLLNLTGVVVNFTKLDVYETRNVLVVNVNRTFYFVNLDTFTLL